MKQMGTSSPRPSPPQVCGGEGEEVRGGGVKMRPMLTRHRLMACKTDDSISQMGTFIPFPVRNCTIAKAIGGGRRPPLQCKSKLETVLLPKRVVHDILEPSQVNPASLRAPALSFGCVLGLPDKVVNLFGAVNHVEGRGDILPGTGPACRHAPCHRMLRPKSDGATLVRTLCQ